MSWQDICDGSIAIWFSSFVLCWVAERVAETYRKIRKGE